MSPRPVDLGFALLDLWFQVEVQEGTEDVVSHERQREKCFDGVGLVLINVIGLPAVDQFKAKFSISQR